MKYVFIMNAIAGRGKCNQLLPRIEKICSEKNT